VHVRRLACSDHPDFTPYHRLVVLLQFPLYLRTSILRLRGSRSLLLSPMALSSLTASALNDTSSLISDTAERSRELLQCCQENFAEEPRRIAGAQLSRFNLWTSNIGVFSYRQASLDYRLRTAPTAKAAIDGNLEILCIQLLSGVTSHIAA
jgi:hypothetical protein